MSYFCTEWQFSACEIAPIFYFVYMDPPVGSLYHSYQCNTLETFVVVASMNWRKFSSDCVSYSTFTWLKHNCVHIPTNIFEMCAFIGVSIRICYQCQHREFMFSFRNSFHFASDLLGIFFSCSQNLDASNRTKGLLQKINECVFIRLYRQILLTWVNFSRVRII